MRLRSFATIAAVTLSALAIPFAAPAQAQAGDARIRLAHFSPDANGVDVYIDGKKTTTLRGENISQQFKDIVENYVKNRWG